MAEVGITPTNMNNDNWVMFKVIVPSPARYSIISNFATVNANNSTLSLFINETASSDSHVTETPDATVIASGNSSWNSYNAVDFGNVDFNYENGQTIYITYKNEGVESNHYGIEFTYISALT